MDYIKTKLSHILLRLAAKLNPKLIEYHKVTEEINLAGCECWLPYYEVMDKVKFEISRRIAYDLRPRIKLENLQKDIKKPPHIKGELCLYFFTTK